MTFWQRLREDITCVFDRDPAARTVFEILTAYPGIHAVPIPAFMPCYFTAFTTHCGAGA